jgi:hypothetical protein
VNISEHNPTVAPRSSRFGSLVRLLLLAAAASAALAASACFGSPDYENGYTEEAPRTTQPAGTSPTVEVAPAEAGTATNCDAGGDDADPCQLTESNMPGSGSGGSGGGPNTGNPPPVPWAEPPALTIAPAPHN